MSSDAKLMQRLLRGDHRQYHDIPARSGRAKEIVKRVRPWEGGRIGKIENHIARITIMGNRDYTTSELARAIYCDPTFDQDFRWRQKGVPPLKLKSWQYQRVRLAAPTFCDCVGRAAAPGAPYLWRPRSEYCFEVRQRKRDRDAARRKSRPED
jgi:hypothetical protein